MSATPSEELTGLLERLGLIGADRLRALAPRVTRLARGLPVFDCLWIDLLARDGILTPFQAAEIIAGRGPRLVVGPFLLCDRIVSFGYAEAYAAQRIDDGTPARVHVVRLSRDRRAKLESPLATLVDRSTGWQSPGILPIEDGGIDADRLWVACRSIEARTAADWMVHNGRFQPSAVLRIAQQMAGGLAALHERGLVHGDVSIQQLLLDRKGQAWLPAPGVRGLVRAEEGHTSANLPPEAFDYLAPERVVDGTPPTTASDMFACGCLWWQMLTGRAPLVGGSSAAKLRAVAAGRLESLDHYVRGIPPALVSAISACTNREPDERPASMARLAAMLGPPVALPRGVIQPVHTAQQTKKETKKGSGVFLGRLRIALAAAAGCLICMPVVLWAVVGAGWGGSDRDDGKPGRFEAAPAAVRPIQDTLVEPATFTAPAVSRRETTEETDSLLLPAGRWELGALPLKTGQTVRGRVGARPLVSVDAAGLSVDVDDVRFENIDFVFRHDSTIETTSPAMIRLHAANARFHGCTFQAAGENVPPVAIAVFGDPRQADSLDVVPSSRLEFTDCVFSGTVAAELASGQALVVSAENTLFLGPGSVLRLNSAPAAAEPVSVVLRHCTLRDAESLLSYGYQVVAGSPGRIDLETTACVLAPRSDGALLILNGAEKPIRLLAHIHWTGHGSLMPIAGALAVWRDEQGQSHTADEAAIDVDGLVRGQLEFAGAIDAGAAASRIVHWQAPLRSTEPPGIRDVTAPSNPTSRETR